LLCQGRDHSQEAQHGTAQRGGLLGPGGRRNPSWEGETKLLYAFFKKFPGGYKRRTELDRKALAKFTREVAAQEKLFLAKIH
jgi:hypothetical protein